MSETTIPCQLVLLPSGSARIRIVARDGVRELILTEAQAAVAREWALWSSGHERYDADGLGCVEGSAFAPSDPCAAALRNTSFRLAMSTCSLRNPASIHALVITLFQALLLHQARCRCAFGGSFASMTRSICANVIGTSFTACLRRNSVSGAYLPIATLPDYHSY